MDFSAASREWAARVLGCTHTHAALKAELRAPFERVCEQPVSAMRAAHGSAHEFMCANGHVNLALANVARSRYNNILPFDHGIVRVSRGGFINASWVHFPGLARENVSPWIITQGPMHPEFYGEDTTGSFWEMVFEHRAKAVVNLARCEVGFGGCARYWPIPSDECNARRGAGAGGGRGAQLYANEAKPPSVSATYGGDNIGGEGLVVTVERCEEIEPGLWRRWISLRRSPSSASSSSSVSSSLPPHLHTLEHFHFENWPNYDVATDASTTATLLRRIVEASTTGDSRHPIVVHCSGGVGRSGTFVAAATTLLMCGGYSSDQGDWSSAHFAGIVTAMRQQRHPWMVEGFEQFHFGARLAAKEILSASAESTY
jgi:protein tyrosine phosphatase